MKRKMKRFFGHPAQRWAGAGDGDEPDGVC